MKQALTFLALFAFIGITVFGFAAMGTHAMGGHSDCIATVGQAAICPHQEPFAMTEMHAQFFQRMTSAGSLSILLVVVLWAIFERLDRKRLGAVFRAHLFVIRRQLLEITSTLHRHSLFSWLTMRQRGDAVLAFAMI